MFDYAWLKVHGIVRDAVAHVRSARAGKDIHGAEELHQGIRFLQRHG